MTNPNFNPYDVEGRRVWDTEEVSPLSGERYRSEEALMRRNQVNFELEPITPAELLLQYGAETEGR